MRRGAYRLLDERVQFAQSVEADSSGHTLCALTGTLNLIAGMPTRIPRRAYSGHTPSRTARLLQVANGARELLQSAGRPRSLVSGVNLAYLDGNIEYFTRNIVKRWWGFSSVKQPFFIVTGSDPAASIAAITGCDPQPAPRLSISHYKCPVVVMANWGGEPAVLKYAQCGVAIAELERQANGFEMAASDPQLRHLLPRVLNHSTLASGAVIFAQTRLHAEPYEFSWRRVDAAAELWQSRKPTCENAGGEWMAQRLSQVSEFFFRFRELLPPPMDALLEWHESTRIVGGITHGDFCLRNILFKSDAVSGIIDWDGAQQDGFLEVDGLYLLLSSYGAAHNLDNPHYLRQIWADEISDAALSDRIARLRSQSGMDKDDLKFIALLLWFSLLWQHAMRSRMPPESRLEDLIPTTVPAIMKWLAWRK